MTFPVRRLGALAEVSLGRQRSPEHEAGAHMTPYLRAANVKDGYLDLSDVKEMNFTPREQATFALRSGDVLVTEGAGSLVAVGAAGVWRGEIDETVCFQNTLLRLRPRPGIDGRYLAWWARHAFSDWRFAAEATGVNIFHLSAQRVRSIEIPAPPPTVQRAIVDFLDAETSAMNAMIDRKCRLVELLGERIDAAVISTVGASELATGESAVSVLPTRRLLRKLDRPAESTAQMVTAFRDGQVTARSLRRPEGYTESWTESARLQGVAEADVVVHGLDGFAGAIGTSDVDGACSPIYHVCQPLDGGDSHFYGRLLRLLATTKYLGLFATSTRERAVDFRNWDLFGRIPIPQVPRAEQRRIGEMIRRAVPLREAVERSEALVRERRHALITAAVTGQLGLARDIAEEAS